MTSPSLYKFGDFEVNEAEFVLIRSGESQPVEPKAFRVLLFLLKNPGRLVTKDEILGAVWDDCSVSDNSLTRSVATLRRLLGDDSRAPRYITTVQTIGYRFLPAVTVSPIAVSQPETPLTRLTLVESITPAPIAHPRKFARGFKLTSALALAGLLMGAFFFATPFGPRLLARLGLISPTGSLHNLNNHPSHAALNRRRLSANPEDTPITSSALSPDGKLLAFADSTGVYFRLVDSGETHPAQLPKGFDAAPECWFPDSIHLIVSSVEADAPPALWEIAVTGGTPHKLVDRGSAPRVSPDGTIIAFLRGPWDNEEIWLVEANGNNPHKIIEGKSDYFGPVAWAHDSKRFAYVRSSGERSVSQVETYNLDTARKEVTLVRPVPASVIAWLPNGKLVYTQPEEPPNQSDWNIWVIPIETSEAHALARPVRITDDQGYVASISVTTDGARISVLRSRFQADVYLADIEIPGRKIRPLHRFTLDERQDFPSSWTPDSKAVLVVSDRDGPSHIFRQQIDQTQPELLVGGKQDVWLPHMAPDGLSMLYLASPPQVGPSDKVRIMRIPLAGGASQLLIEEPGIENYQCARPPSTVCVYGRIDADYYRFFTFDSSRGNRAELSAAKLKKEMGFNNWNLSPDGKYLAMLRSQKPYDKAALRLFNLSDNTERTLAISGVKLIMGVDWAADSKSVWVGGYMGRGSWGTRSGLVNVDLSGHQETAIAGLSPAIMGGTPSPDGHRLAVGANTFTSNVWLLEDF